MNFLKKYYLPLAMACILLLSVALYLVSPHKICKRFFVYSSIVNDRQEYELRRIPWRWTEEERMKLYIEELLLGPSEIDHGAIVPEDTVLRSVLLRKSVLYADFSRILAFPPDDFSHGTEYSLEMIKKNIRYNFHGLRKIVITIDGQVPFFYSGTTE